MGAVAKASVKLMSTTLHCSETWNGTCLARSEDWGLAILL